MDRIVAEELWRHHVASGCLDAYPDRLENSPAYALDRLCKLEEVCGRDHYVNGVRIVRIQRETEFQANELN